MFVKATSHDQYAVLRLIERYLPKSRFRCDLGVETAKYAGRKVLGPWGERDAVRARYIRLRKKKSYCGQHAGPCPIDPVFGERPHRNSTCLEGSDWVGWDDMINDILDRHKVEATVWSKGKEFLEPYFIRRGRLRRTAYLHIWMTWNGHKPIEIDPDDYLDKRVFRVWDPDEANGNFSDLHFGAKSDAPRSVFTEGTPGIAEWRAWKSRKLERLLTDNHH